MLKPVVQEEATGCAIASVANILGKSYSEMQAAANAMGIHASDKSLWSDTQYVRRMLLSAGVKTCADETPFETWEALPDLALLSIKHHQVEGKNFWHWVVFKRVEGNLSCSIRPVIFLPISVKIFMRCSLNGFLRSM